MLIAEALTTQPVSLPANAMVTTAAAAMRDNDIGDVLVVDDAGELQGIVTDRDIAIRVIAEGRKPTTRLKTILSQNLVTADPMDSLEEAAELMREQAVRRLPVVTADHDVVGVISLGDLAHELDPASALAEISEAPPDH